MIEHPKDEWEHFLDEFYETFSVIGIIKYKIFICGSYKEENLTKLIEIKNFINNSSPYHLAFLESDFKKTYEKNFILKFDLLADFSNEIIMVIEHDKGGHMIELGIILTKIEYRNKTFTYVLRNAQITQMLTGGGFIAPFFIENQNLFYFNDIDDLRSMVLEHLDIT